MTARRPEHDAGRVAGCVASGRAKRGAHAMLIGRFRMAIETTNLYISGRPPLSGKATALAHMGSAGWLSTPSAPQ